MARIAVIAGYAPSLVNFRRELLECFVNGGHEVVALAPDFDASTRAPLAEMGVRCQTIGLSRTGLNPLRDLTDCFGLVRVLRMLHPDIVLSYTAKPVIYGSLAARPAGACGIYSIITGLGYAFSGSSARRFLVRSLLKWLYRWALSANRAVFFQNPDDLALFCEAGLVKEPTQAVLVKGSGVNLDHFPEVPARAAAPSFLLIARLLKEKGIVEYVEAARLLRARHPQVRFRLVGPLDPNPGGIEAAQLDRWASEGMIDYLGAVDDVRPLLADASVYVLPSYREGTPRSVLEAMATGRPIVTTDAPGCRETVVEGVNGFLVPARDVAALAVAMERFILESDLIPAMGRASRRLAEEKYDVHKINAVILDAMGLGRQARR